MNFVAEEIKRAHGRMLGRWWHWVERAEQHNSTEQQNSWEVEGRAAYIKRSSSMERPGKREAVKHLPSSGDRVKWSKHQLGTQGWDQPSSYVLGDTFECNLASLLRSSECGLWNTSIIHLSSLCNGCHIIKIIILGYSNQKKSYRDFCCV